MTWLALHLCLLHSHTSNMQQAIGNTSVMQQRHCGHAGCCPVKSLSGLRMILHSAHPLPDSIYNVRHAACMASIARRRLQIHQQQMSVEKFTEAFAELMRCSPGPAGGSQKGGMAKKEDVVSRASCVMRCTPSSMVDISGAFSCPDASPSTAHALAAGPAAPPACCGCTPYGTGQQRCCCIQGRSIPDAAAMLQA